MDQDENIEHSRDTRALPGQNDIVREVLTNRGQTILAAGPAPLSISAYQHGILDCLQAAKVQGTIAKYKGQTAVMTFDTSAHKDKAELLDDRILETSNTDKHTFMQYTEVVDLIHRECFVHQKRAEEIRELWQIMEQRCKWNSKLHR